MNIAPAIKFTQSISACPRSGTKQEHSTRRPVRHPTCGEFGLGFSRREPLSQEAPVTTPLTAEAYDQIFRNARTQNGWTPQRVADALLRDVYDLAKMGPTSANCSP